MSTSSETVGGDKNYLKPIYKRQIEGVSKMRASLLASTEENSVSLRTAIQSITAMRIYHQLLRIVKYTDLMDKLEDKLYDSILNTIDTSNTSDATTWIALLGIQEKLQKQMIDSHKLLQPYLDVQEFTVVDLIESSEVDEKPQLAISSISRDNIRAKAQAIMSELQVIPGGLADEG